MSSCISIRRARTAAALITVLVTAAGPIPGAAIAKTPHGGPIQLTYHSAASTSTPHKRT